MNIFYLHSDPKTCASMHCDKHVVKMILETAQMLSTAHHELDGENVVEGLYKSMGFAKRNTLYPQFTDHCFTGEYPIKPIDANDQTSTNKQLSFMSSKS